MSRAFGSPPPLGPEGGAPRTSEAPPPVSEGPPPLTVPPPASGEGTGESGEGTHALHHTTEQTRTFPCTRCGGELVFDIGVQQLTCGHCGDVQELRLAQDAALGPKRDLRRAVAEQSTRAAQAGPQLSGQKEVVCQNCGGHTTFTGTLTSTRCPYCATPIQRDDVHDAPSRLPVDGVLPFSVDEKAAKAALEKWVKSRWFAPREFKTYSRAGSFASVYTAYFSYDADTVTRYTGRRGDDYTVTVGSGDNRRTETRTRWRKVSGQVQDTFTDLTVLANEGLQREHVTALEPWPVERVRPFSPEYVAGHLCRTYDNDAEVCFGEAEQRMEKEIESTIRRDIGGDKQRITSKSITYRDLGFAHLLLPLWLLTVLFDGRPFQVVINGATGEVHGERPYSKVKIAVAVLAAVLVGVVALLLYNARGG